MKLSLLLAATLCFTLGVTSVHAMDPRNHSTQPKLFWTAFGTSAVAIMLPNNKMDISDSEARVICLIAPIAATQMVSTPDASRGAYSTFWTIAAGIMAGEVTGLVAKALISKILKYI